MWAQGMVVLLGIWLLASPDIMGYGGYARVNNQVVGVWMAAFGMIAISECLRAVRWANVALGVWLILAPFVLDYSGCERLNRSRLHAWQIHAPSPARHRQMRR